MTTLKTKLVTNLWVIASWDDYIQAMENPEYNKTKGYYQKGKYLIEMIALGNDYASDHYIIGLAIALFAGVKNIPLNGKDNVSYRKTGIQEAQPDLSFYIGENVNIIPYGTKIINLDNYPLPNLVVEIGDTSLADDLGQKRILYEDLGVKEY